MKKILVGFDGSEQSAKAFLQAIDLAKKYDAEIEVVAVARPPEPPEMVETEAMLESATEHFRKEFAHLKHKTENSGVKIHFTVMVGSPADQLIHRANEINADLIVLGHRGKSYIQRWLLGSISRRVVSYASCSVYIVR